MLSIDLGSKTRTIVSGLKKAYKKPELLQGKMVVVLCNAKSANLGGVESQGMVLTGIKGRKIGLLTIPGGKNIRPGTSVTPDVSSTNASRQKNSLICCLSPLLGVAIGASSNVRHQGILGRSPISCGEKRNVSFCRLRFASRRSGNRY